MADHLVVAREGQVRLFRMNGNGAVEVASLALGGPLPSDEELAVWSAALVHMADWKAAPEPKARKAPKALPAAKVRAKPRSTERVRRDVLTAYADGEWHLPEAVAPKGLSVHTFRMDARKAEKDGYLERRLAEGWSPIGGAGRQPYEYRLTERGKTVLNSRKSNG